MVAFLEMPKPPDARNANKTVPQAAVRLAFAIALLGSVSSLLGDGGPGNGLSTTMGQEGMTQLAVPGGAGATITPSGTAAAGPVLGFQVWQLDNYFLSGFFTFSVPQGFSGQPPAMGQTVSPQQSTFGTLVLNPPGQGTSYSFTGSKVWGWYPGGLHGCSKALPVRKLENGNPATDTQGRPVFETETDGTIRTVDASCSVTDAYAFIGGELRGGITNAAFTEQTSAPISLNGSVAYVVPELMITSRTYNETVGMQPNQYQFGVTFGPSFRFLGGDFAQKSNNAFREALLGTSQTSMTGVELTFFLRLNQFKPYVRFTHFSAPKEGDIAGFSGSQFIFGVDVLSPLFQTTLSK